MEVDTLMLKLIKRLSNPYPTDFADIATDFYKRFYSTRLHIFGSGHGSKAHLSSLIKALRETELEFTYSLLNMNDPSGPGGYREVTNWKEVRKKIPPDIEVIVNWDDWAVSGASATSSLINILLKKDEFDFKQVESGNTNDLCGQGNYFAFYNFTDYSGPRKFLEERFPKILDPLKTEFEQLKEERAREQTIQGLRTEGLLDAISTYRFQNPKSLNDLANEYNVREDEKRSLFDRIKNFKLKRKAIQIAEGYLNKNTYGEK